MQSIKQKKREEDIKSIDDFLEEERKFQALDKILIRTGKKCLELLANNQVPDLIILDILMPVMSGWETFQKIREKKSGEELPIIFLTARKDQIAKDAGGFLAEDFIEKPFKLPDLKEKIDKILSKK